VKGRARTAIPLVVLVGALLVAGYISGVAPEGPPLDPRSAAPLGTKALVDTLEALGAEVRTGSEPRAGDTAVLVLTDTLDEGVRDRVRAHARDGGVVVVADPSSELTPDRVGSVGGDHNAPGTRLRARCMVAAAVVAEEVRPRWSSAVLDSFGGGTGCFPAGGGYWLVVQPEGRGAIVALGEPGVLTNARLRESGHAVLAVGLLAPEPETAQVTIIRPPRPGEGDAELLDLVPRGVWLGLVQLGIAFLLVVLWRGRRLVQPAEERQPVALPASELVVARGNLLADARARERAARLIREDLRQELSERCGLPLSASPDQLADVLMARYGLKHEDVAPVRAGTAESESDLVTLAQATEALRRKVLHTATTPGG
jgi:hypothetical protein